MSYTLVIGNKAWSSWSLRPWLMMKVAGIPFEEVRLGLRRPDTRERFLAHSPSGRVPVLKTDDGEAVWDSLAILEYLHEHHPEAGIWPTDSHARARARSVAAEMHSGFPDMRRVLGMDLQRPRAAVPHDAGTARDVARVQDMWREARTRFGAGGPFLFGRFSAADAMYAPVVTRFDTYDVPVDTVLRAYMDAVFALPGMQEWIAAARREAPGPDVAA
jgi:glutathione S-transferase